MIAQQDMASEVCQIEDRAAHHVELRLENPLLLKRRKVLLQGLECAMEKGRAQGCMSEWLVPMTRTVT